MCVMSSKRFNRNRHLVASQRAEEETLGFISRCLFCLRKNGWIEVESFSSIDKTAYESKGKAIIRKLGTGFYREYLKRRMKQAKEELDFIVCSNEISDEYYPDLMRMSSLAIISILQDYGYEVPPYIKELTWEKDYSCDSNADEALQEIEQFWKRNRKACTVTKNEVIIELGTDKNSQKKVES